MYKIKTILFSVILLACINGYSQPYAIPGALGFAKNVRGAYAGSSTPTILTVDRLTDDMGNNGSNKGSFRWCLTQTFPRIILFEVSGYINLTSVIRVYSDHVSVYGQTAPSPGITVSGVDYVDIRCDYVVMQHLRFRPSYNGTAAIDAMSLYNADNIFIDHCSFSYAEDECFGMSGSSDDMTSNVTVQNCIFSSPLNYNNGKGLLAGDNVVNASVLRSAFIHCATRSPYPNGANYTRWENVNTLCYNPAYWGQECGGGNHAEISIIGNVWKAGPRTSGQRQVVRLRTVLNAGDSIYLYNNYSPKRVGSSEWNGVAVYEDTRDSTAYKVKKRFSWAETNYYSYKVLEDSLVANAGSRPWDRDLVDVSALEDMVKGTGSWITNQSEAYYPALAENTTTLNVPASPHANSGNGYTNLEVWVYKMTKKTNNTSITNPVDISTSEFKIYPNPARGNISIDLGRIMGNSSVTISGINGQIVRYKQSEDQKIIQMDLKGLNPGIYFVRINTSSTAEVFKIIKE